MKEASCGSLFLSTITNMPRKVDGMPFEIHPSPMKGKDGKNILYVRPRSGQKISMEGLDDYCAQHYGLRPGELARAFHAFVNATGYYLSEGYRLETLIGSFAPKIALRREVTDPDDIKTYDVRFEGIEYRSAKTFEESVRKWLRGFRRANNPNTQELLADKKHIDRALQECIKNRGYATARHFARCANITYYSARKRLDEWCQGDTPRLLKSRQGQEFIYTET